MGGLSVYKDYIQKSRLFLYPALELKRGSSVTPVQTYTSWNDRYKLEDRKLSCVYHLRDDEEFKRFEKDKLMGHKMFHDFKITKDGMGIYIFDFSHMQNDWDNFINGKYSKLSNDLKQKIRNFFGVNNRGIIDSYLYPERFHTLYVELLIVDQKDYKEMHNILKNVKELCSKPDLEKENLFAEIKDLHMIKGLS